MQGALALKGQRTIQLADWQIDLLASLLVAVCLTLIQAARGFPSLSMTTDTDSLLRMVEVRDLLNGQGWFDLHQYRMGPEGGFVMHWSRVVDAPIAAIVLAVTAITGSAATGELVAQILWPALLLVACMFLLIRLARAYRGVDAVLPTVVVGGLTLMSISIFAPGALDHHNVQLVLCLATLLLLVRGDRVSAASAGFCSALMLAVGMETAPFVAVAGLCVAGDLLVRGREGGPVAIGFGLGFASAAAILFAGTVSPSAWSAVTCDAYSMAQFAIAAVAGAGIAATAALTAHRAMAARLIGLAILGAVTAATLVILAPQCLSDPFASLDKRLLALWLDYVAEAQPLWKIATQNPAVAAMRYVTPLIGLMVAAVSIVRMRRRMDLIVGAFLLMAFAVSVWQVRGSTFSVVIALIPLTAWIARWRTQAAAGVPGASLKMVVAWLASANLIWGSAYFGAASVLSAQQFPPAKTVGVDATCTHIASYAALAKLPRGTILSISNQGPPILAFTNHRVLNGPYHRNVKGNLDALDALTGNEGKALEVVKAYGVTFIAFCPGSSETEFLGKIAPDGLIAKLSAGEIPGWLEPVAPISSDPVRLFRVR